MGERENTQSITINITESVRVAIREASERGERLTGKREGKEHFDISS